MQRRARTEPGGGTSVSPGRTISLSAVLIVTAATALVVYVANREDDTPMARVPAAAATASDGDDPGDGEGELEVLAATALDAGVDGVQEEAVARASFVQLDALYDELAAAELYTWVDVSADDPETIVLRSWYCNDDRVAQAVDRASRQLRGAGFAVVRCLERAGSIVFEKPLR